MLVGAASLAGGTAAPTGPGGADRRAELFTGRDTVVVLPTPKVRRLRRLA